MKNSLFFLFSSHSSSLVVERDKRSFASPEFASRAYQNVNFGVCEISSLEAVTVVITAAATSRLNNQSALIVKHLISFTSRKSTTSDTLLLYPTSRSMHLNASKFPMNVINLGEGENNFIAQNYERQWRIMLFCCKFMMSMSVIDNSFSFHVSFVRTP